MVRLVVLDRDGVINHDSADFIKSPEEWHAIDGSPEAIARLHQNGFTVAVASNQSGLGRGLFSEQELAAIHAKMLATIEHAGGRIDHVVWCPHRPDAGCDCRKPLPGLLQQLAEHYDINMNDVPFIGDSDRDVRAAQAIDARPILVGTGNGRKALEQLRAQGESIEFHADLGAAVDALLAEPRDGCR